MATVTAIRMTRARRHRRSAIRPWRLAVCTVGALALAAILLLQAASSVLTRKQPDLAIRLFPANGLALEPLLFRGFKAGLNDEDDLVSSAQEQAALARRTVAREPLTPKAHGILTLAAEDPQRKQAILTAATTINRRDLFMQGLVLERQVGEGNFPDTLATLDRLLRVHPDQKAYFFTILGSALQDPRALPAFADILDGSSAWHIDFLRRSADEPALLDNLTLLRDQLALRDEEFDRRLIMRLAHAGKYAPAYAIYRSVVDAEASSGAGSIPWTSSYAPFDWRLAKETGLRGQSSPEGDELEVFVRRGEGGIVAARVLPATAGGFAIMLDHTLGPPDQVRDVRLQLRCDSNATPFFDERFQSGPNRFEVDEVPPGCEYLSLAIHARAWSGRSHIRGTIGQIRVEPS